MLQIMRTQPVLAPMREMLNTLADGFAGSTMPGNLPVDIIEKTDCYEICASVPGMDREDITIELENGILTITAVKAETLQTSDSDDEACADDCCMIRRERFAGSTSRQLRLPTQINDESINACLENGVLTITVAKPTEHVPTRIDID